MLQAALPLALQIVIDDVGWWSGENGSARQEPYRTGCPRSHVPADYQAIVELGRRLGMRPQAATILGEWDRENILRDVPSATWQGADWDNSRWQGPWLDEAAQIIREGQEHYELVIHGLGHEYWEGGTFTRAEWHDREGRMRPVDQVRLHLDYYARLLAQNDLGEMPKSFVPAAFLHRFGSAGGGLAAILAEYGVQYFSTPFSCMFRDRETETPWLGVDCGLLTVDRGHDLVSWHVCAAEPVGEITGPICGMHWPNLLHEDPARNCEVVERWVQVLQPYDHRLDRMLGRNTAEAFSQCAVHSLGQVTPRDDAVDIDLSALASLAAPGLLDSFTLKIAGPETLALSAEGFALAGAEYDPGGGHHRLRLQRPAGIWRGTVRVAAG